ncbi:hypothetical protein CP965_04630 [Halarcobacter mediterraneus]|uniref:DUF2249 domain-containing protein n=1 Tax=Halarcobacter mediterraneus TaxID=2023153 RepID=A0A4Q1AVL0_9BACT|nr:hypothetical protein [Halarcobacter mediterraneus]RXK13091.1 hypothetical protein CP965_04630 [Halarcobacter mediterraneus]
MEKIEVQGASVDFFKSIEDGLTTYHFDTSKCGPPEPMVNAMAGLQLLDENSQLIMINHKSPAGLFPKIEEEFTFFVEELENGLAKVVFRKKANSNEETDFTQTSCGGTGCNH